MWFGENVLSTPFFSTLCCLGTEDMDAVYVDQHVRRLVREGMRMQFARGKATDCIEGVMQAVVREDHYNLGSVDTFNAAYRDIGARYTRKEWDNIHQRVGHQPLTDHELERPARVVPRFAAAVVVYLRAKLGVLTATEANHLLVQRKYLEVCKLRNVRNVDIVSHQQFVLNAFFREDVLDRIGSVRSRLPMWLRWMHSIETVQPLQPMAC